MHKQSVIFRIQFQNAILFCKDITVLAPILSCAEIKHTFKLTDVGCFVKLKQFTFRKRTTGFMHLKLW